MNQLIIFQNIKMLYRPLLILPLLIGFLSACPTNETLKQLCLCESSLNGGILLDCSGQDASMTLKLLRTNQVQFGLILGLTMKNASLTTLEDRTFKGLYIKKLDLSENSIENIEDDAFDGLENILEILILSKNQLSEIPNDALDGLAALAQLDLANNTIGNLEDNQAIRNTPKLFDLNLGNNRICKIQKTVLDGIKHSAQTLNLGHNCLTKVPASAIRGFKQLQALHMHANRIPQLEPLQFMNLPLLYLINLAENQIGRIHRQSFLNVPNLRFIYLTGNNITELQENQFRHFETLEMLDLTNNKVEFVPRLAFANMPRLSRLYLGRNRIGQIEEEAFANSSIIMLVLEENRLTELNAEMLDGLTFLQQFSVKNNEIEEVAQNTFHHMPNLVTIDLSGNQISELAPATFLTQLNLFVVELSRNKLSITPYNAFNKRVGTVILQENPLVCRERVHLLQNGVGVYVPGTEDRVCGGYGAPLVDPDDEGNGQAFIQDATPPTTRNRPVPSDREFKPLGTLPASFFTPPPVIRPIGPAIPALPNVPPVELPDNFRGETFFPPVPPVAPPPQPYIPPPTPIIPVTGAPSTDFIQSTIPRFIVPTGSPGRTTEVPLNPDPVYPRTIRPFPVPFISNNPLNVGYRVTSPPTTTLEPTLPAGVITANRGRATGIPKWTQPKPQTVAPYVPKPVATRRPVQPWQETYNTANPIFPQGPREVFVPSTTPARSVVLAVPTAAPTTAFPVLPIEVKTVPPKKPNIFDDAEAAVAPDFNSPSDDKFKSATAASATTTIAVCLTVVVVVMVAVFVTLCVVRHRSNTRHSPSSTASRTSAYVAAQAARFSFATNYGNYGTASLARPSKGRPISGPQISAPLQGQGGNGQTWIYAPGTYANPSSYYGCR